MKESIENILYKLERILRLDFVINVRIIEATKSVLKARVYFSEDLYIQQIYEKHQKTKEKLYPNI